MAGTAVLGNRLAHARGCEDGINDEDCWENGSRAHASRAAPCGESSDDQEKCGEDSVLYPHGRQCDNADDRGDCWESGRTVQVTLSSPDVPETGPRTREAFDAVMAAPCNDQADDDADEGPQARECAEDGDVDPCWQDKDDPAAMAARYGRGCNGESDYVCWAGNDGKRHASAP